MTTRYTTMSGSVYEVREVFEDGPDPGRFAVPQVRRVTLGAGHRKSPEQLAKRQADGLDDWRNAEKVDFHGIGYRMLIVFDSAKDFGTLITSPVTEIEEILPS